MESGSEKEISPPIPPENTEGKQTVASEQLDSQVDKAGEAKGGIVPYPMTEALSSAIQNNMFLNPAARMFLQTLSQLREVDLEDARSERTKAQAKLDEVRDKYNTERENRLVLEERLRGVQRVRRMQKVFLTLGGILFGRGVTSGDLFALIFGGMLLILGIFYQDNSGKEKT